MRNLTYPFATLTAAMLAVAPAIASAGTIFIPRDTVVPVVMEGGLTLGKVRVGDHFTAHVDNDRDLPFHTRLIGVVRRVEQERNENKAFVDMEFTDVILPDGSRHEIQAMPVSLDDRYTMRRDDGRIVVKDDAKKHEGYVLGGAVGGFILGSIIHKQAEATLLGTLAGVIAAKTDKNNGYTIFNKGQKIGMLVDHDVRLETYDRGQRPGNRGSADRGSDDRNPFNYGYGQGGSRSDDRRGNDQRGDDRRSNDQQGDDRRNDDRRGDDRQDNSRPPVTDRMPVIAYEGKELRFSGNARPYRDGNVVMVPLQEAVKALDLKYEHGETTAIYVDGENASLRLEQGSKQARLNGRTIDLPGAVVDKDGVTYIPVAILASLKSGNLLVDGNRIEPKE